MGGEENAELSILCYQKHCSQYFCTKMSNVNLWGKKKKVVLKVGTKHSLPGKLIYDKITLVGKNVCIKIPSQSVISILSIVLTG